MNAVRFGRWASQGIVALAGEGGKFARELGGVGRFGNLERIGGVERNLRGIGPMRKVGRMLALAVCLACWVPVPMGQGSGLGSGQGSGHGSGQAPQPNARAGDNNPFPGEVAQPASPTQAQAGQAAGAPAKPASDNPFPGEDTNAPILPATPDGTPGSTPAPGGDAAEASSSARRDTDPDGDPVRSPDAVGGGGTDDGFSSSRAGLANLPAEDDNDGKTGKSSKNKTREQVVKEDIDVGGYYLDRKNWKAAQARFASAFALDAENPDAVFGLAEAERHLGLTQDAAGHYKLFLAYDPDGPHSRAARKGLDETLASHASQPANPESPAPLNLQPK